MMLGVVVAREVLVGCQEVTGWLWFLVGCQDVTGWLLGSGVVGGLLDVLGGCYNVASWLLDCSQDVVGWL